MSCSADTQNQDCGGVYLIFCKNGQYILNRLGFAEFKQPHLIKSDESIILYIGASRTVHKHVTMHLKGDSRQSNLRITFACALAEELKLIGNATGLKKQCHFGEGEERLSAWLREHLKTVVIESLDHSNLEANLIRALSPPLNITSRRESLFAQHLMAQRRRFGYEANLPFAKYRRNKKTSDTPNNMRLSGV